MMRVTNWLIVMALGMGCAALHADAGSSPADVDAQRNEGAQVATWPIFHQIVAFVVPKGFVPAEEKSLPRSYVQASVLQGETVDKWTQMITVTGAEGAATRRNVTPESFTGTFVSGYQQACPTTFSSVRIPSAAVTKYSGTVSFLGCGYVGGAGEEHSESMLLITLKGDRDYYTIQWAERGPASSKPPVYDENKWTTRFRQLMPIRVCPRVRGEAAPYPSCIDPKAK